MTDKQIIIDGVDVSGCDFLSKEDDYCSYSGEYRAYKGQCGCSDEEACKDHPNCFYKKALKQLKRKEQECKVLALDARVADNHLQHRIEMCDLLREKLKAKEQECDKLKFNLKGAGILGLMKRNVQLKKALDDIEINISEYQGLILGKPRTMRENDCIYNILNIIDKVKELK